MFVGRGQELFGVVKGGTIFFSGQKGGSSIFLRVKGMVIHK